MKNGYGIDNEEKLISSKHIKRKAGFNLNIHINSTEGKKWYVKQGSLHINKCYRTFTVQMKIQ